MEILDYIRYKPQPYLAYNYNPIQLTYTKQLFNQTMRQPVCSSCHDRIIVWYGPSAVDVLGLSLVALATAELIFDLTIGLIYRLGYQNILIAEKNDEIAYQNFQAEMKHEYFKKTIAPKIRKTAIVLTALAAIGVATYIAIETGAFHKTLELSKTFVEDSKKFALAKRDAVIEGYRYCKNAISQKTSQIGQNVLSYLKATKESASQSLCHTNEEIVRTLQEWQKTASQDFKILEESLNEWKKTASRDIEILGESLNEFKDQMAKKLSESASAAGNFINEKSKSLLQ